MSEIKWYSERIGRKFDEFDEFDKYITDVLKAYSQYVCERERELLKTVRERNAFNDGYSLGCSTSKKIYGKS